MILNNKERNTAYLLTFVQYLSILLFLYLSPLFAKSKILLIFEFIGVFVGIYAIYNMMNGKLRITPIPDNNATLVMHGLYKYIRHPMYFALLLTFTPLLISHFYFNLFIVYGIFSINLLLKLKFEESLLIKKFPSYQEYLNQTKMIIPFLI